MIVSCIEGGLGNQLFQYFHGYAASRRLGVEWGIDVSTYGLSRSRLFPFGPPQRRELALERLGFPCRVVRDRGLPPRTRIAPLLNSLPLIGVRPWKIVFEPSYRFSESFLRPPDGSLLVGYFQSEKYFAEFEEDIRSLFDRAEKRILDESLLKRRTLNDKGADQVGLHVRLGDYVTDPSANRVHGVLTPEYYRRAIETIRAEVAHPYFFIFSDSPVKAVEVLSAVLSRDEYQVVSGAGLSDLEEFFLLRQCRHHVVANSSYSWWAAWSARSGSPPGRPSIKVAPAQWFSPDAPQSPADLIPSTWIQR